MDFKLQRRNSLSLEVDGLWTNLEEEEDTPEHRRVSVNECTLLQRVLGPDKVDVMPKACRMANTAQSKGFMSRLSHINDTPDVAGKVNLNECHHLSDALNMISGGPSFLPVSCQSMLKREEKVEAERFEQENAKVYQRLKRRQTFVGVQDWPPTTA